MFERRLHGRFVVHHQAKCSHLKAGLASSRGHAEAGHGTTRGAAAVREVAVELSGGEA